MFSTALRASFWMLCDQFGNLLGRLRGLFGQLPDFVGDHSKSQAMLAGARRFDGGIQRQQVGLFGQIVDDLDDLADVVGALPPARR